MRCIIVDDEPIARDLLSHYCDLFPGLELVAACKSAAEAYPLLLDERIDLVFSDIRMPVISGIEFIRSLRRRPLVIFATAYSDYAVEGFELHSVDYLVKPVTFERFYQAVQRAAERLAIPSARVATAEPAYVFLKQDTKLVRVEFDSIDYVQAERDFSSVYTGNRRMLAGMHLKVIESLLPASRFFRVHRSFIVQLDKIREIKGNMLVVNDREIPLGGSYREALLTRLGI